MKRTVADDMAAMLAAAGVARVYGAGGCGTGQLPGRHALRCIEAPQGRIAAFAAVGEAQLTGRPAVCCGDGAGSHLQMAEALYEATRGRVPVVAIAPQVATDAVGSGDFRESRPEVWLRDCSGYCEMALSAGAAGRGVAAALRHARAHGTPGVVVLPADVACAEAEPRAQHPPMPGRVQPAVLEPAMDAVARLAELLNHSRKVVFLCGGGCAGAHDELVELARRLGAPIAYTLGGKEVMEKENPCVVGMVGLLGWGDAPAVVQMADLLVIWGADVPCGCRLPVHGNVVQVDADAAVLGRRVNLCHAVHGDVRRTAALLLPLLRGNGSEEFLAQSLMRHGKAVAQMEAAVREVNECAPIRPEYVTRLISCLAEPDAVFAVDVGPPLIWAVRYVQALGHRRFIGSFHYGAADCALAMALGAKAANPSRQVIALCRAGSLQQLPDECRMLVKYGLSVKVFVYNDSEPESECLQGVSEVLPPVDYAALAEGAGMKAVRLSCTADAPVAVRAWLAERGPALLDARLDAHALAAPPDSAMLRMLQHFNAQPGAAMRAVPPEMRRLLFGNRCFYTP